VLAVKPQVFVAVAKNMDFELFGKLIFSVAAGLMIARLEGLFIQLWG